MQWCVSLVVGEVKVSAVITEHLRGAVETVGNSRR